MSPQHPGDSRAERPSAATRSSYGLAPPGWSAIADLVCGFGDRTAAPPPETRMVERQVHGTTIIDATAAISSHDPADGLARIAAEADALVAARPGIVAAVRTADCVPILLVAPQSRWAAAVHAGWRGTLAGIAREAVARARADGIEPEEIFAALGPSIGPCCYEVSPELGADFRAAGLANAPGRGAAEDRKPHLDLRDANRLVLESSGLLPHHIEMVGPCTRCAHDRYHSFRADPASAGRQVSWIGWAP